MFRVLLIGGLLAGSAAVAQAQNAAPATPTQRPTTERVSPLPGVTLPTGAGQRRAEPLNLPTQFKPAPPRPAPRGNVSAGPLDSARIEPAPNRTPPARPPKK